MSIYPHDWIPADDPVALLRCSRCPAEAAVARDVPKAKRPPRAFAKVLVWRASPKHRWCAVIPIPVCEATRVETRRGPQMAKPQQPRRLEAMSH